MARWSRTWRAPNWRTGKMAARRRRGHAAGVGHVDHVHVVENEVEVLDWGYAPTAEEVASAAEVAVAMLQGWRPTDRGPSAAREYAAMMARWRAQDEETAAIVAKMAAEDEAAKMAADGETVPCSSPECEGHEDELSRWA